MKTFYYEKLGLRPAVLDIIILRDKHIISRINTPMEFRGRGIGSRLLRRACADADAEGIELELVVSPSDGLDRDELYAWYSRHGFVSVPEVDKFFMVRKPIQDSRLEFVI
jgi:predicted N-acetyltransferase YhbS